MRLTPAQLAMSMFLGERLVPEEDEVAVSRMVRNGHGELVLLHGRDLGYDPMKWHEALSASESDEGGYRWSNGHRGFPRRIREAMANAEWRAAIAELASTPAATRPAD